MCGICGVIAQDRQHSKHPAKSVQLMVNAMRHRGPDASGIAEFAGAAIGMTRLAILDTTPTGNQPMYSPDGRVTIVYNGETYNSPQLRTWLESRGHIFSSRSDTEVILYLYLELGNAFVERLRGMFAIAILDMRSGPGQEKLLLTRDPFGIKPLLYGEFHGNFVFASELKAILASKIVPRQMDPLAMRCLLSMGSIPQPRTAIKGVRMLEPGHTLSVQSGRIKLLPWWRLERDRIQGLRRASYEDQVVAVRQALEESLGLQLLSDVPLGAFLSGGVDSATLVALTAKALGYPVKTFSVGFGNEGKDIDETGDAQRMARHIGANHTRIEINGGMVSDCIMDIAAGLDQPTVDGVNSFFVCQAARRDVTVAISGTGGDEIFGGYPWFANMALWEEKRRLKGLHDSHDALSKQYDKLTLTSHARDLEEKRMHANFLARFHREYRIFNTSETANLIHPELRNQAQAGRDASLDHPLSGRLPNWSSFEKVSALCLTGYTQNQLLRDIDCVSMHHSLEVRVPFLDSQMVDLAFSLPDSVKIAPNRLIRNPDASTYKQLGLKRILIDACRDLLPKGIENQQKRGFGMPFDAWLQDPLKETLMDTTSKASIASRGLFNFNAVTSAVDSFFSGKSLWVYPWLIMMTELWCRQVLDGE